MKIVLDDSLWKLYVLAASPFLSQPFRTRFSVGCGFRGGYPLVPCITNIFLFH